MAMLSLFLDLFKVDKLLKEYFFKFMFLYTENVNAFGYITYKDNEHLAVKCIVLQSLGGDGLKRWLMACFSANMWVSEPPLLLP